MMAVLGGVSFFVYSSVENGRKGGCRGGGLKRLVFLFALLLKLDEKRSANILAHNNRNLNFETTRT